MVASAHESEDDWEVLARRMERVPDSIASFESALRAGIGKGLVAARRQALGCAQQAATWGGEGPDPSPFFTAPCASSASRWVSNRSGLVHVTR